MNYKIKPGAMVEFFNAGMHPLKSVPVSEYGLDHWSGTLYNTPHGQFVLIHKNIIEGLPGGRYMGINTNMLSATRSGFDASGFQSSIHGAACDLENTMRSTCNQEPVASISGTAGYIACKLKCAALHPFNREKRTACQTACASHLSTPDLPPPPVEDPPPPPPPGSNTPPPPPPPAAAGGFEIISLDDLKFLYGKLKSFFQR